MNGSVEYQFSCSNNTTVKFSLLYQYIIGGLIIKRFEKKEKNTHERW